MNDRKWNSLDAADKRFVDDALRSARNDGPDAMRMREIERRLVALEQSTPPAAWWRRSRALAVVGLAIVAFGVVRVTAVPSKSTSSVSEAPTAPETAPVAAIAKAAVIPATASVAVEALPAAAPVIVAKTAPSTYEAKPRASAGAAPGATQVGQTDELALLEEASQALEASPQKALALTDEHLKRFRAPKFAQERERLAIVALVRLGRRDEAKRRADAFEAAYPESAHLKRVRELVNP